MPEAARAPRTQQQRRDETRRALLDAAVESLIDVGFARTTTLEVQRRADVSRGALLHHFPSKAELLGEVGGFSLHLGSSTFYPVQVAEKGFCWIRARLRGEPGHGSMPRHDSVVTRLGEALTKLGRAQFPVHATRHVSDFLE